MTTLLGEKLPVLFIGKSAKPRCFKNIDLRCKKIYYGCHLYYLMNGLN